VKELQGIGVAARGGFRPMSTQQEYRYCRTTGRDKAEQLGREMIVLPIEPEFDEEKVNLTFKSIQGVLASKDERLGKLFVSLYSESSLHTLE
jgi:dTDP-4-amino-4,6-dideoxygalactose transaminase